MTELFAYDRAMNDLDSALDDIARIREQLAASIRFQGLAPGIVAISGCFALALGLWQYSTQDDNLIVWILLAAVCALMIGIEAVSRARKAHRSMADRMLGSTLNRFLPVATAGAISGVIVLIRVPEFARILPGIWQLLMGIGIFAVLSGLPRQMTIAGGFYLLTGAVSLFLSGVQGPSATLLMALPFGCGQLLVAAILYRASREIHRG